MALVILPLRESEEMVIPFPGVGKKRRRVVGCRCSAEGRDLRMVQYEGEEEDLSS